MSDVFDSTTTVSEQSGSALDQLVGEGKKFKTVEDLAAGKLKSDTFVEQLEGENKAAREKVAELEGASKEKATVADLIEAVRNTNKEDPAGEQPLSEEAFAAKIKNIMQGETDEQTRKSNREQSNQSVLDKVEGNADAARVYLEGRAKELRMSVAQLTELGERSPEAFTELMNIGPTNKSPTPAISSLDGINTIVTPQGSDEVVDGHRTKAYYDKLKGEIGITKFWNDPKIQGAMYKDQMALGDKFKSQN
jgi:hypothetical protein